MRALDEIYHDRPEDFQDDLRKAEELQVEGGGLTLKDLLRLINFVHVYMLVDEG